MVMDDSFIPPPMIKFVNGQWIPIYNPTPEDYRQLNEQRERERKKQREENAKAYWSCFNDVIREMFRWN